MVHISPLAPLLRLALTASSPELPFHDYIDYYGPDYRLHITPSNMENLNSREYLEKCRNRILDNLRHLAGAPSVPLGTEVPPDALNSDNDDDDEQDPDLRPGRDGRRVPDNELSDSDDEDDRRHDGGGDDSSRTRRQRPQMSFKKEQSPEDDEEVEIEEGQNRENAANSESAPAPAAALAAAAAAEAKESAPAPMEVTK